jgi:hypothetical protein
MLDSVCQAVVHKTQNKADIEAYHVGDLNSQTVGMGHHDEGIERLGKTLDAVSFGNTEKIYCSDASGWDVSVSRDAIYFDTERRIGCFTEYDEASAELLWLEAACNTAHILVIGGLLYALTVFGVTASGITSTSAQNSPIRAIMLLLCGAWAVATQGDDEFHTGSILQWLLDQTGCITKGEMHESGPNGPVEFTSHILEKVDGEWVAKFGNVYKMLAHLDLRRTPGCPPQPEMVAGMRFALRHTPEADALLLQFIELMGWYPFGPEEHDWMRL